MRQVTSPATSLDCLFRPRSVAIIGASDDPARIGGRPLRYLRESGFAGTILPVNSNRAEVQGIPAFKRVDELPMAPDLALIAVPASAALDALRACGARGTKAAVVFSAGFAETGAEGAALQSHMLASARAAGMRLLGPNCLGVFDSATGFYGTFSQVLDAERPAPGPVAIVSQSGAYGSHVAHLARERGLGIRYFITTGNEADIDVAEGLAWLAGQPDVSTIIAYAEGIKSRDRFLAALEMARRNRKAIVFMKVGRSPVGAHAVASHTAALAGADEVYDAVFRQYGVYRARTTAEQIDVAYVCARGIRPKGNRLGIFTLSGGFGIQLADAAEAAGLDVAPMPAEAQAELKALLPYASPQNPVDATAQALTDPALIETYVRTMLGRGGYDAVIGVFGSSLASPSFAEPLARALDVGLAPYPDRLFALMASAPRELVRRYEAKGFLIFEDGDSAVAALGALTRISRSFASADADDLPDPHSVDRARVRTDLSEHGAKGVLADAGIPVPREELVPNAEAAAGAAERIGFPVVLKIASPDIPHKTEIGGVLLDIRSRADAQDGAARLIARARAIKPSARIEGVLVSSMLAGGIETIVGVTRDPVFGPVVMFGLGGIFVEVLKDVTFRVAPFGLAEARRMIREVKGHALLEGVRGRPRADIEALARVLSLVSVFAARHADDIEGLEINPLLVMPEGGGAFALDALLFARKPPRPYGEET